jgi:hypothetical protein
MCKFQTWICGYTIGYVSLQIETDPVLGFLIFFWVLQELRFKFSTRIQRHPHKIPNYDPKLLCEFSFSLSLPQPKLNFSGYGTPKTATENPKNIPP